VLSADPAGNFSDQIDGHRIFALEIATQFALNDRRTTNHARAAEIAFVREMNIATSANCPAEAGRDFVIAQIDMGAATRAIRRSRLIADFMFAFALKTGNNAIAL